MRELGLDDDGVLEIMQIIDLFSGLNALAESVGLEPDEKPWYG